SHRCSSSGPYPRGREAGRALAPEPARRDEGCRGSRRRGYQCAPSACVTAARDGETWPTASAHVVPVPTRQGGRYTRLVVSTTFAVRAEWPAQRRQGPAPAINNHAPVAMEVQIFGTKKSADTRKALRFFSERRVKTHFVDLNERAASPGELKRFVQKFGLDRLIDRDSKRYEELGLRSARLSDERWLEKLADEPLLLQM